MTQREKEKEEEESAHKEFDVRGDTAYVVKSIEGYAIQKKEEEKKPEEEETKEKEYSMEHAETAAKVVEQQIEQPEVKIDLRATAKDEEKEWLVEAWTQHGKKARERKETEKARKGGKQEEKKDGDEKATAAPVKKVK